MKSESFEDKWLKGPMGKVRMGWSGLGKWWLIKDYWLFLQGEVWMTWLELGEEWPGQLGEGWPG